MEIDESEKPFSNAPFSMRTSFIPIPNDRVESATQFAKQLAPSISTDDGMESDASDEQS
jgi:hypothetical protein